MNTRPVSQGPANSAVIMPGKWFAIVLLVVAAGAIVACRKTPTALEASLATPSFLLGVAPERAGDEETLKRTIREYEEEPTGDRAMNVWAAFGKVDAKLSELRKEVAQSMGGDRAEAELARIELKRTRDEQMERFVAAQARIRYARAAFNNLAASIDEHAGVRAAASVLARGFSGERMEWKREIRSLQGRLQMP